MLDDLRSSATEPPKLPLDDQQESIQPGAKPRRPLFGLTSVQRLIMPFFVDGYLCAGYGVPACFRQDQPAIIR